jgi:hypothetical protein
MNTSLSIFARALATENLSFSFDANAPTASFDVKTRHLVMPVWNVSDTLQTMLVAHEISHALWTPYERSEELMKQAEADGFIGKLLHRICNVIEDVRIEKMMKAKYPGTRRDFFLGYKEVVDSDLFKFSEMDIAKVGLINRMNIHFKWGIPGFMNVNLSDEEQGIADMIDAVQTFDEAFQLAKALYEHPSMDEMRKKYEQEQQQNGSGKGEPSEAKKGKQQTEGLGMVDMEGGFVRKTGADFTATTVTLSPIQNLSDQIIPTDELLWEFERQTISLTLTSYREFVKQSDSFVRQLVAQFERRKAADEIRRERPKQTGMLNLDRLHQYRTHDDIFLSKIVKQDGKNHGICFFLDCSGSMGTTLSDCFLQILQLVWFCEKAKIPFEVFGFTECSVMGERGVALREAITKRHSEGDYSQYQSPHDPKFVNLRPNTVSYSSCKLIQLASSSDNAAKRERLLAFLYEAIVLKQRSRVFSLGSTPTVEAVMLGTQFVQKWVADNNIQIPTVMVVTDGQPNGVNLQAEREGNSDGVPYCTVAGSSLTVNNEMMGQITRVDTQATRGMSMGNVMVSVMLDDLRKTLNARTVGMFVGSKNFSANMFSGFCVTTDESEKIHAEEQDRYRRGDYSGSGAYENSPRFLAVKETYNREGCIILPKASYPGYDGFFLIKTPKIVKDEDAIADGGTFTKIKNTFVKTMGQRGSSRVFLTRYVDIVAGQPLKAVGEEVYRLSANPAKKEK